MALVSHFWSPTWYDFSLLFILCQIFCDFQLPHVFFHYLTPGLLWPTYWPSIFHLKLHCTPKYAILIPTFYMTKASQPCFPYSMFKLVMKWIVLTFRQDVLPFYLYYKVASKRLSLVFFLFLVKQGRWVPCFEYWSSLIVFYKMHWMEIKATEWKFWFQSQKIAL